MLDIPRRSLLAQPVWHRALVVLFVIHWGIVAFYVLDVPIADEWDVWYDWNTQGFWRWLYARHNEHIVVPTRLHMYFTAALFGAHPRLLALSSFSIYGILLWACYRLFRWSNPERPTALISAFLVFLLSTLNVSNHLSGFHSQFHFVLLFLILAIPPFFERRLGPRGAVWVTFLLTATVLSFSTGVGQALVLVSISVFYRWTERKHDARSFQWAMGVFMAVALVAAIWLIGHVQPPGHPHPALPFSTEFTRFFLNLVSFGFGIEAIKNIWGVVILLVLLVPVVVLVRRREMDNRSWGLIAGVLAIFAAVATVSMGRGPFGTGAAKSARYGEISLILIPLAVCLWGRVFEIASRWGNAVFIVSWGALFALFANNWSIEPYRAYRQDQVLGINCLKDNITQGTRHDCPTVFPLPLGRNLDRLTAARAAFLVELVPGTFPDRVTE